MSGGNKLSGTTRRVRISLSAILVMLCLSLFLAPGSILAADKTGAAAPNDRFGVASSHLSFYEPADVDRMLDEAASSGIGWVRCAFAWSDLEPARGDWRFEKPDMVVRKARERNIKVLGILAGSPGWANGGNPWNYPPTDLEAWTIYAWTVSNRYRGIVSAWEIWNEENIDQYWKPGPDPARYVQLLGLASAGVRAADPEAKVVMGGVAGLDPQYLDDCLGLGAAEYVDAVAYHPYPETLEEDNYSPQESRCRDIVGFLRWLVSEHTTKDLEIWITELGWTTCAESPPGVSEQTQASYLLRSLINYAGTDVDMVFSYNLRDEHLNEHDCYGLLRDDYTEKPSYRHYATFNDVFSSTPAAPVPPASFDCAVPESLEAHCFTGEDGSLRIGVWKSDDSDDSLTIALKDCAYGEPLTVDPSSGEATPTPGVSRGEDGLLRVSGLAIGKTPVVLVFDRLLAPHVFSLSPAEGTAGTPVDIRGFGFGPAQGSSRVDFGGVPAAAYLSWTDGEVRCSVPAGVAGEVEVRVVTESATSNAATFAVFGVSSITPDYGIQGSQVAVTNLAGGGFQQGATVRLERGGSPTIDATSVVVVSGGSITCFLSLSGAPLGRYDVVVRNPDGREARLGQGFRVTDACGGGAGASISVFAGLMGLLSMAGYGLSARGPRGRR